MRGGKEQVVVTTAIFADGRDYVGSMSLTVVCTAATTGRRLIFFVETAGHADPHSACCGRRANARAGTTASRSHAGRSAEERAAEQPPSSWLWWSPDVVLDAAGCRGVWRNI